MVPRTLHSEAGVTARYTFPPDSPVRRAIADAGDAVGAALSEISGVAVRANALDVSMLPLADLSTLGGKPDDDVVALFLTYGGTDSGQIMLVYKREQAHILADQMLWNPPGTTTELDEMALSALAESGNILGSHFLTAIANCTGIELAISTPEPVIDIRGAVLSVAATSVALHGDSFLSIQIDFTCDDGLNLGATLLVVPEEGMQSVMMRRLT
jgi:chemotaxis protein CheC